MARIRQVGPGRKTVGTIDGITYVTRNGVTYVRSAPTMPASAYNTPAAKRRQALFKLIMKHIKYHLRTIRQTFTPLGNETPFNRYFSANSKGLTAALDALVDQYLAGEDITITEIEAAISTYAAAHPKSICIASKSGYQEVYLTGDWPATITLNAQEGDSTVIIIVAENGSTTTINANGSITTGGGSNSSGGGNGSNSGSGSGGSNPSNPSGGDGGDGGDGGEGGLSEG